MKISFVIAVYQNEGSLSIIHQKIMSIFPFGSLENDYEIIFVDDGSKDGSLMELLKIKSQDSRVKIITFTRNFGQMPAIIAGLKEATGDAIINISADLQDPIELVPQMLEFWQKGAEVVICYRTDRSDGLAARIFSWTAYKILRFSIPQIPPGGFDFLLMDRKVVDVFNALDVRHRFFQGDILWSGHRTSLIPYVRLKRTIGKSQFNFGKKLKVFLDAFLDASYLPIRFMSLLGLITSALGLIYSIAIVFIWFRGGTPFSGWAPIMIAILLVGGLIMLMLGLIGEYIWRINEEVRKRPNYVVRDKFL
jgi:glycosyltransferase involved in cell wall biosynthesis